MKCRKCQHENPDDAKFCNECAGRLEAICPDCGKVNPAGSKFCNECAHDLRKPREIPPIDYSQPQSYTPKFLAEKILTNRSAIEGERKLVTVLFADVANYTSISEKLDPEEVHQILDGCFNILMDEVHRYEGTINQFTGDGVMALFGAPVSHEDHAQRACHAALSIHKTIRVYAQKIRDDSKVDLAMRIGLNSGPVIVGSIGDDLRMDYTAIGDTTNLAARIQQAAEPGEVWLSQATRSIVRDFFHDGVVGEIALKGKTQPQRIYRLISEREGVRTRFQAGLVHGVTELVGRHAEMEALRATFEKVRAGEAQVVDIVGEAGVGKSRLVYEFQRLLGEDAGFLSGNCIHYGRNINFLPVIDVVREAFGIEEGMTEGEVGNRIEENATEDLASMIPFYRGLLSLKVEDPKFNSLSPEGRKFGTFEAVKSLLFSLSAEKPLVIFLDDVHWLDKNSEEFFTYFSRSFLNKPILLLAACRPEGAPSWAQGVHYQRVGLETLGLSASTQLVRNILDGLELEPDLQQKIAEKTGGNPLFMEEIVRELLDRGDLVKGGDRYTCKRSADQLDIPDTVQGVLAARMDRLSEDLKRTMQVASVIGRDFAFRILTSIGELGHDIRSHLNNLVGLEILYEKALYPELEYIFKHSITQEVAYESLLRQRRREIHGRIAQAIEAIYADRLDEHYEILAHHYERSGNDPKAVEYLLLAGEKSNGQMAVQAAHEFFSKAAQLRDRARIALDPETELRLQTGMGSACIGIGDISTAVESVRGAVELSRRHGMIEYERESLGALGFLMYLWPVRSEAEQTFEDGIARAREIGDKVLESSVLASSAVHLAMHGQPYRASQMTTDAERIAMETGDLKAIGMLRFARSVTERWIGRPAKAIELTEGLLEALRSMSNEITVTYLIGMRGVALAEIGRIEEAMEILRHRVDVSEKLGANIRLGVLYNTLGYCYSEIHQPQRAWEFNLKSEAIARKLMKENPMGVRQFAEIAAQANVNLMENLLDRGEIDAAWGRMKSLREESRSEDFDMFRHQWESRMDYLGAQILIRRNEVDEAEILIRHNLEKVREQHAKKREGGFLRLLGEVKRRRGDREGAIADLREGIGILREVGNPRQLWQAHSTLAAAFDQSGRSTEAREQWCAAAEVVQQVAQDLSDGELREGFLAADPIRGILSQARS